MIKLRMAFKDQRLFKFGFSIFVFNKKSIRYEKNIFV